MNNYKFELEEEQIEKFETWQDEQMIKDKWLPFAGERFSFKFTPSGIGTIVVAIDEHLKEEINLTDYSTFA
jgi:hypothetical protein